MKRVVSIEINGVGYERFVEPRLLLSDFIRHEAHLTGTHVGCEHGVCGACTIQLDSEPVRSCLLFAVQTAGGSVRTVEALAAGNGGQLDQLQRAFRDAHALQCGFCTPGFLMTIDWLIREDRVQGISDAELREALAGNLYRCTGYGNIVRAVRLAGELEETP